MLTEKAKLLQCLSAEKFAAWELHLYLDTHPCDKAAQRMHEKHMARAMEFREEYERRFGPLSTVTGEGCEWLKGPWPWEKGE